MCFSEGATPVFGSVAWHDGDWCGNKFHTITATDYDTAIITRSQYEAALAKNDGWIEWGGGECPVPENSLVEVKYRDGTIRDAYKASGYIWANGYGDNETTDSDIIAYRLHLDINSRSNDDQLEQDLNECIGHGVAAEWDGEGLPPAGCECEVRYRNADNAEWVFFRCVGVDCGVAFGWLGKEAAALGRGSYEFRPLRTEAEKAREDAETAMRTCLAGTGAGITPLAAKGIYEAIAAGKIPGINLEAK